MLVIESATVHMGILLSLAGRGCHLGLLVGHLNMLNLELRKLLNYVPCLHGASNQND